MIRVAHGGHHFAFDILLARGALRAEQLLIVDGAVVRIVLGEESAGRQRLFARLALEAGFVKVFLRDAQHFAGALLLALGAIDFCFTCAEKRKRKSEKKKGPIKQIVAVSRVSVDTAFNRLAQPECRSLERHTQWAHCVGHDIELIPLRSSFDNINSKTGKHRSHKQRE